MADAAEMDDLAILRVFSERDEWKRLYLKADARADELDEKVDALLTEVERLRRANQQLRTRALGLYHATESLYAWGDDWQTEAKAALAEVERLRAIETAAREVTMGTAAWPLDSVLAHLVTFATQRLDYYGYDGHGWEVVQTARDEGNLYIERINALTEALGEGDRG